MSDIYNTHGKLIHKYDILQVKWKDRWEDFSSIRSQSEAAMAMGYLQGNVPSDFRHAKDWRIVRGGTGKVVAESGESVRRNPVKSSKGLIARAESWWGVSHNVPTRGTAAHKRMVAKFRKTHPHARMNPMRKCAFCRKAPGTVTVTGNKSGSTTYFACAKCAKPLKKHKDLRVAKIRSNPITTREGRVLRPENCSKSVASHLLSERKAQGRKGKRKSVREGRCDYRAASYALRRGGEGSFMGIDGRLLGWWPSSK
jgi:ribosomal protein L24E